MKNPYETVTSTKLCHTIVIAQTLECYYKLISPKSHAPTHKPLHLEILENKLNPNATGFEELVYIFKIRSVGVHLSIICSKL